MQKSLLKKYIPGIAWFFILAILLGLPGGQFPQTDDWFKRVHFDKWVHAGLFGMLAYLFMRPMRQMKFQPLKQQRYLNLVVIFTSLWGLATEFLQEALIDRRTFDVWDWVADTAGALIALLVYKKYIIKRPPGRLG